jgi:hypothetical protein
MAERCPECPEKRAKPVTHQIVAADGTTYRRCAYHASGFEMVDPRPTITRLPT